MAQATQNVPLVLTASPFWGGNDGNWSTFNISVGTPPQQFYVIPSIASGETWVPAPEACEIPYPNCTAARGVANGSGFQTNASSTWQQTGIFELGFEQNLFGSGDAGLYGLDTVELSEGTSIQNQTVAAIATPDFWLGSLGLGIQPAEFGTLAHGVPTILSTLRSKGLLPSLSYGYSAGAFYRSSAASLVLGGYDQAAFTPSFINFPLFNSGSRSLTANVRNIIATNTAQGPISLQTGPNGLNMSIDSTVSQIWLPGPICDQLSGSLGLTFDSTTGLYIVNSTSRGRLLSTAPTFTFTLAAGSSTNQTVNIALPYTAFDKNISYPYYNGTQSYFPIRRAANASQLVLGRTFLQEAYVFVNWDRMNFTLGQRRFGQGASSIVTVVPSGVGLPGSGSSKTLSAGAIAGIAVGGIVGVALVAGLIAVFWWRRKRRSKRGQPISSNTGGAEKAMAEDKRQSGNTDPVGSPGPPVYGGFPSPTDRGFESFYKPHPDSSAFEQNRHELEHRPVTNQLMSTPIHELQGHAIEQEMASQMEPRSDGSAPFSPESISRSR